MKKLLAILCTVALLLTSLFTGMAVAAEETTELTQFTPSSYGADEFTNTSTTCKFNKNTAGQHFIDATFTAMIVPQSGKTPYISFGKDGSSLRFIVGKDKLTIKWYSKNSFLQEYPLSKNYNEDVAYKITVTSRKVNPGVALGDETFDETKHQYMSYNVYLNDELVAEDYRSLPTDTSGYYTIASSNCLYLGFCYGTIYDVETYERLFSSTMELTPSSFGTGAANGQTFTSNIDGAWAGSATSEAPKAFYNASFEAKIVPYQDTHWVMLGKWSGIRFTITDQTARLTLFDTEDYVESADLGKSYNGVPYTLKLTSDLINEGKLPAAGEEYTTAHEHIVYNAYIDGEPVIENFVMLANHENYNTHKTEKLMRASKCTMYDVATFEEAFTATDADAPTALDEALSQYPVVTPADFGIEYGKNYKEVWGRDTDADGNIVFETNVMFDRGGKIVFPRSNSWNGVTITTDTAATDGTKLTISDDLAGSGNSVMTKVTLEPATFNVGSLVGNMINLKIVYEVCDADGNNIYDAEGNLVEVLEDDVRLTYYINGIKAFDDPIEYCAEYAETDANDCPIVESRVERTGTLLFTEKDGETIFNMLDVKNVILEDPNTEVPVMFENVAHSTKNLVVGKLNTTDATLAEGDSIAMGYYGTLAVTEGALVYTDNNGTATTVATDMAGVKFNLKALAERVDLNDDGFVTETKARVWIDNKAIGGYQYLVGTLPIDQAITLNGTAALSAASQVPTGLIEYSLADVGAEDVDVKDVTGTASTINKLAVAGGTVVNTLFSAKINVSSIVAGENNTARTQFLTSYAGFSIEFWRNSDLSFYRSQVLAPGQTIANWGKETPAVGTEYTWQVAVQATNVDLNADGVNNDIRIGFFINGELFGGNFYASAAVDDVYAATPTFQVKHTVNAGAEADGETPAKGANTISYTVKNIETDSVDNYEEIGIEYFGLENGTYELASDSGRNWLNKAADATLNGKVFKTKIKFDAAEGATLPSRSEFTYAGNSNLHHATTLFIAMESDGVATVRSGQDRPAARLFTLPGLTEGEEHELWITSKVIEGHWKYMFYVDGELARVYYQKNAGISINKYNAGVHSWGATNADYSSNTLSVDAEEHVEGVTADTEYTLTPSDTVSYTVDGAAITEATVLNEIGKYVIASTTTGKLNRTGTKTVVIYKENDLNADGEVNVLDFIAAKKSNTGDAPLSEAGAFAAGIEIGAACELKDIVAIKIALLLGA